MSETGRDSLLRLRALMHRLAAPLTAFAEIEGAETAIERLAGASASLPLVDFNPLAEIGKAQKPLAAESRFPDRQEVDATPGRRFARPLAVPPGRIAAGTPSPFPGRKEALGAPGKGIAPRTGSEPPVFRLGGSRTAAGPAIESEARSATRETLERSLPTRNRERVEAHRTAGPPRGQAAPAGPAGTPWSATPLAREPLSESPRPSPGEPVGLGLVANLLAHIAGDPSASAPQGILPATRKSLESPVPTWNRERPTSPPVGESLRGQDAPAPAAITGAGTVRSLEERPVAPIFPTTQNAQRAKFAAEVAPFGGSAADPLVPSPPSLQTQGPALDPDLLADLVNDALVAQAVRFGVDLS